MIILHTPHLFTSRLHALCVPNLDEVSVCLKCFGCRLLLMIFVFIIIKLFEILYFAESLFKVEM